MALSLLHDMRKNSTIQKQNIISSISFLNGSNSCAENTDNIAVAFANLINTAKRVCEVSTCLMFVGDLRVCVQELSKTERMFRTMDSKKDEHELVGTAVKLVITERIG